jgi:hypothetical protein
MGVMFLDLFSYVAILNEVLAFCNHASNATPTRVGCESSDEAELHPRAEEGDETYCVVGVGCELFLVRQNYPSSPSVFEV